MATSTEQIMSYTTQELIALMHEMGVDPLQAAQVLLWPTAAKGNLILYHHLDAYHDSVEWHLKQLLAEREGLDKS